jgi:hypothetical protein
VPPKVEYKLTQLGLSLGAAFCGVWIWVAKNLAQVEKARIEFDERAKRTAVWETGRCFPPLRWPSRLVASYSLFDGDTIRQNPVRAGHKLTFHPSD